MKLQLTFKSLTIILTLIVSTFLLSACTRHIVVNVNAITDMSSQPSGQRYFMTNANDSNATSELYFQEFRTYFDHLLTKNGYVKVDERKDADIVIRFHYGVSDGKTAIQHYSWPIYETFGGERVTITERITDSGGNTQTINRTVYIPPVVRQVGSAHEAQSYTYFNRYINLAAFPAGATDDGKTMQTPLWNVNVYSVGESDDLRAIMPFLAAASDPFLGKNSGQQQSITLGNDNPLVIELRSLVTQ
ncbi:hypothetical protein [Kaarinaea lacus]